jgi:hypothetical protein
MGAGAAGRLSTTTLFAGASERVDEASPMGAAGTGWKVPGRPAVVWVEAAGTGTEPTAASAD